MRFCVGSVSSPQGFRKGRGVLRPRHAPAGRVREGGGQEEGETLKKGGEREGGGGEKKRGGVGRGTYNMSISHLVTHGSTLDTHSCLTSRC